MYRIVNFNMVSVITNTK